MGSDNSGLLVGGLNLLGSWLNARAQLKATKISADTQYEISRLQIAAQQQLAGQQQAFQRKQYERQRRDALADAERHRINVLHSLEEEKILQNWPLRLYPSQLSDSAGSLDADQPIPLVILLSVPSLQTVDGHVLDIEGHVRGQLHQFLAEQYNRNSGVRPVELLDLAWKDQSHRGVSSIKALHSKLAWLPTMILEVDLVETRLTFQGSWWGPFQEGYEYVSLGEIDWRALLQANARERAGEWRSTRAKLISKGRAADLAEADEKYGGENAHNLLI